MLQDNITATPRAETAGRFRFMVEGTSAGISIRAETESISNDPTIQRSKGNPCEQLGGRLLIASSVAIHPIVRTTSLGSLDRWIVGSLISSFEDAPESDHECPLR